MLDILLPGGLYRVLYGPDHTFTVLIVYVHLYGTRIYAPYEIDKILAKNKGDEKGMRHTLYECVEMQKNRNPEIFSIEARKITKPHLIKMMRDISEWPIQAIRLLFSATLSDYDMEPLYDPDIKVKDINFRYLHMKSAMRRRKLEEKRKGKMTKSIAVGNFSNFINATFIARSADTDLPEFDLKLGNLPDMRVIGDKKTNAVAYNIKHHKIQYFDERGLVITETDPPFNRETIRKSMEEEVERRRANRATWVDFNAYTTVSYGGYGSSSTSST
jgi:hypothetical protein